MVPSPRIEREPPALQAGVQADYTNSANVLVAAEGLKPSTFWLLSQTSCRCSTPQRNWSQREGSNLRPNPYEGPDLPLIYSAGIGADGGGRTRISTMARSNSQPLNVLADSLRTDRHAIRRLSNARELVETLGLEPRFSGCRPEVLPLNDVPINHKTNVAAAGLTALGPGFRAPAGSMATTAYGQK
jgi:hypothetical protein